MVKITEPMTMVTDYILTIQTFIYFILIIKSNNEMSATLWAYSLLITSFGAFLGGTSHGFKDNFSDGIQKLVWKLTVFTIGLGATFMMIGTLYTVINGSILVVLTIIVGLCFLVYTYIILKNPEFINVIRYYIPIMLIILVLQLLNLELVFSIYIIGGILITFLGFGVQAAKIAPHEHFNHNDLFHVIQMVGAYVLYLGLLLMTDS